MSARCASAGELQLGDGNVGRDQRATVAWAVHPEASVEYAKPVGEPEQSASVRAGASDAVVTHLHLQHAVFDPGGDLYTTGVSVLCHVGQRLGHDEVGRRLGR